MQRDIEHIVRSILADVIGIEPGQINGNTARDNTPGWDSVNHITLTLALEEEFGITFDVTEIEGMFCFADIVQVIEVKV